MDALAEALLRGVGSDSDSRRSRRRKRVALLVGCSAILVVISLRVAMLAKVSEPQMRHSVLIGWFTCLVALVFGLALHRQIRRQPLLRQGVYFFTVLALYMALGRTAGLVLEASPLHFHTIELVGVAGLCAIEIPHIGRAYLWPTALALLGVLVSLLWPAYALVTAMTVYLLLSVLVAALRPWSASPRAALSSSQGP